MSQSDALLYIQYDLILNNNLGRKIGLLNNYEFVKRF